MIYIFYIFPKVLTISIILWKWHVCHHGQASQTIPDRMGLGRTFFFPENNGRFFSPVKKGMIWIYCTPQPGFQKPPPGWHSLPIIWYMHRNIFYTIILNENECKYTIHAYTCMVCFVTFFRIGHPNESTFMECQDCAGNPGWCNESQGMISPLWGG